MNVPSLLLDLAVAENQSIPQADAVRLALVGSFIKPPALGLILAAVLARQEASSTASSGSNTSTTKGNVLKALTGGRLPLKRPSGTPASNLMALIAATGMPSFHGMEKAQVEQWAKSLNLSVQYEGVTTGRVEWQEPGVGKPAPADNVVKLRLK